MVFTTKTTLWYDLHPRRHADNGSLMAYVHVPADSRWFNGHFPGNPILPGIAQLDMVTALIGKAFGRQLAVHEVSRVRFKQMILPDDRLVVLATAKTEQPGAYAFRITKNDQLVCNGNITVSEAGGQE